MSKRLIGKFNDITGENTYWVQIGSSSSEPFYINDMDDGTDEQVCFTGDQPVTIENDMSDTFENVYIRQATINLLTNFDIRDIIVADNYTDIPVLIRKDNNVNIPLTTARTNSNSHIVFSGFVIPMNFNQEYTQPWNEIAVECVDKLGILEYKKFPPLLNNDYNYNTPRYFINKCLTECGFTSSKIKFIGGSNNHIQYDYTDQTKINPAIFVGESEDDWMTCKEVLENIGLIYGTFFYQDADICKIENIMLYDTTNPVFINKDDYMSDDTNISVSTAYNKISCTVDISEIDETFIDPFKDEYMTPTTQRGERILSEIIAKRDGDKMNNFYTFKHLCDRARTMTNYLYNNDWSQEISTNDENREVYDTYCQIMENSLWDFGEHSYLTDGHGDATSQAGNTYYAIDTLKWLWNNPGKGAFVSFGKTNNLLDEKNKRTVKVENMENMLLIQLNGLRDLNTISNYYNFMGDQIEANKPVCKFHLNTANSLVPNDRNTTNYLVISGKIQLNPITPKCGPFGNWDPDFNLEHEDNMAAKNHYMMGYNTIDTAEQVWDQYWNIADKWYGKSVIMFNNYIPENGEDSEDKGKWYQCCTWNQTPEYSLTNPRYKYYPYNCYADLQSHIAMPYSAAKYEKYEFLGTSYKDNGDLDETDSIPRIPILACRLKIGNKYLVEDFSLADLYKWKVPLTLYNQVYSWRTEDQLPSKVIDGQTVKQDWFTISIDPGVGDKILGKEFDFADTVSIGMNIKADGMAIPIPYSAALSGEVDFEILGPYNPVWKLIEKKWDIYFVLTGKNGQLQANERSILSYCENILLKEMEFKLYSDNGGKSYGSGDNDLVYTSAVEEPANRYIEGTDFDLKFCTSLTSEEAHNLNIEYNPNNSAILKDYNGGLIPWTGMSTYKGYSNVKLEEARVNEQYNIWKRPRNIVETTIRLVNPELAYLKTNYIFNYFKYSNDSYQIYRTLGRTLDLKANKMTCSMKEISEIPS